jgi:methylenetetrahydrofolate reductase (NADPH)
MNAMISIELVPRSQASIAADLETIEREFPAIRMVNIPDLLRFDLRSWDACAMAIAGLDRAVPHLRAMDFPAKAAGELASRLSGLGLREALIVRGDAPQDLARPVHSTTSAELIRALKEVDPELRLYAVFDPYRRGLRAELDELKEKIEAGAAGLFTQPFFDLRFMQVCADVLPDIEIFWGLAPVLTAGNRRYWEVKNRAFFPADFKPSLAWNRAFAASCIEWAKETEENLYFMPIRLGLSEYLGGLIE